MTTAPDSPAADSRFDGALRIATIIVALGLGVYGLASPESLLRGGLAWLAFLLLVMSGWGYAVVRLARIADPDFGLRAVWGVAGYLGVTGALVAAGICSHRMILALIGVGVVGFAWRELTTSVPSWHRVVQGVRYVRTHPSQGALVLVLAIVALVQVLGAVAALDRNPWDDDIAYTPMIKRLLDVGDLVEPFSFRRLGAYGGQTVLGALAAARGTIASVHLIDRGLMFVLSLLLVVGYARERKTPLLWSVTLLTLLVVLPDTSINTAAHWSGLALFITLYRTVGRNHWGLVGIVAAATCTLRQNYLPVVVVFVGLVLLSRLRAARRDASWGEAWARERRWWIRAIAGAFGAIACWWVAALVSSKTFLFPIIGGTWNHELSVSPLGTTWAQKLSFVLWSCIESTPIIVMPVFVIVMIVATEDRPGRPFKALLIASLLGFVLLAGSIAGAAEPSHVWRYAFGFAMALSAIFVIEIGDDESGAIKLVPLGRWLFLASLVFQLVSSRAALPKRYAAVFGDIREAQVIDGHGDPSARAETERYARMQSAIPKGARLAVMLDDAANLDFTRNSIANLDTPGFASPGRPLPAFDGAEEMRQYFVEHEYRYLAFVRPEHSRYFFRREFWLWRVFNDNDFFQMMSAYELATIDSFTELATTTTVLYDKDGLVVLDLGTPLKSASRHPLAGDEPTRRSAWVEELATREHLHDAWSLNSRANVRFEDGVAGLQFVDAGVDDPAWFEIVRPRGPESLRGTAIRGLFRRAHVRVRGATNMHLVIHAAVSRKNVFTRPRLDVSLDGEIVTSAVASENGRYVIDVVVPGTVLAGNWHDLYLVFGSVLEPDKDLRDQRVSRLESFAWVPAP